MVPEESLEPTDEWLRELGGLGATNLADTDPATEGEPPVEPVPDFIPVDDNLLPRSRPRR